MKNLTTLLPYIQDIRRFGSAALDLCYIAEGKLDGFYDIELKSWDVQLGPLILEEAGGTGPQHLTGAKLYFGEEVWAIFREPNGLISHQETYFHLFSPILN